MEHLNNNKFNEDTKLYFKHLSESERYKIQKLYNHGHSCTKNGTLNSRDKNNVLREMRNYSKMNLPSIFYARQGIKPYTYYTKKAQLSIDSKYILDCQLLM